MAALSDGVQVHYNKRFVQYKYVDNAPGVVAILRMVLAMRLIF